MAHSNADIPETGIQREPQQRRAVCAKEEAHAADNGRGAFAAQFIFRNVHYSQIGHFQQVVIRREHGFSRGFLSELSMKSFCRVGCIDETADLLRKLCC